MLETILEWGVVAIPAIAGLVGWLLPVETSTAKHRVWLVISGITLSGLIFFQQSRARDAADNRQSQLKEILNQSLLSHQYTKGQLDSITIMIGKFGEKTTDPALKQLATAFSKMRDERIGKTAVPGNATEITIIHGFNDPNVAVFPSPSWNTNLVTIHQDATSVRYMITVQTPAAGVITWRASRMSN